MNVDTTTTTTMNAVVLACARCGSDLTGRVTLLADSSRNTDATDGAPALPAGSITRIADADRVPVTQGGVQIDEHEYSPAGAYAGNPDDLVRSQIESVRGSDNGCCGSDGCDGPNRRCLCGAVLGTEWSDCWTASEFRFAPDAVVLREAGWSPAEHN